MSTRSLRGFRAIEECLRSNPSRIRALFVGKGLSHREKELVDEARRLGIPVRDATSSDRRGDGPRSAQTLEAQVEDFTYADESELLQSLAVEAEAGKPAVLVLDGITDPQNLGALIRTAAFMGMRAVILPKDRAAAVNDTVLRVAAGGAEHVAVLQVTNIVNFIEELKKFGFWAVGFGERGKQSLKELERDFPAIIVIGSEEKGMRPLVERTCDHIVRLEAAGTFTTLNASVAGALAMAWAADCL